MNKIYQPSEDILAKYAELIVQFGIQNHEGKRLKKGSVIQFTVPEVAKPLYFHLQRALLKSGYNPLGNFIPSYDSKYNIAADYYLYANKAQLEFLPKRYVRGLIDQIDGSIHILAESNPQQLASIASKKILQRSQSQKSARSYRWKKIDAGKLSWTLGLYGTEAAAKEAGLTLKAYWEQIIKACYLDKPDPVREWKRINRDVTKTAKELTDLKIQSVQVKGEDVDLTIGIGSDRKWLAGGGNNIPSYEVFTSPTWQKVDGWIRFNQPHYRYGKKIDGIELWFKNGEVVKSKASKNHDLLKSMLKTPGGNKLGEFSLTDASLSRITKFMAEILYDENMGGKFGNTHVALGSSFHQAYSLVPDKDWKIVDWLERGFNHSVVHSDLISTTDRTVTATLENGQTKIIYQDGHFVL